MNAQAMTERFEMRLGQSVLAKLDSWRARQGDLPSRSEAARRLLEAGLDEDAEKRIVLSNGEKLIALMLCQLSSHLSVEGDIEPAFVEEAINGGHCWALGVEHPDKFHVKEDAPAVVDEVKDILFMWRLIERGFEALSKKDKDRVAAEAQPFGEHAKFSGFDGIHEGEHVGVARFLIEQMSQFIEFKGRNLDAGTPTLDAFRRMLSVFQPLLKDLKGRYHLNAPEIIKILQAQSHPSNRKS
jgi:uncharacterized protein YfbU (UPF0304 family)